MAHVFELRPLLVAVLVGAVALWTLGYVSRGTGSHRRDLALGAGVGAVVQVGVRLAGVS
jgi:hypothetical protein